MILIGEDLLKSAKRLENLFTEKAQVPANKIEIVEYLRPGGGGSCYTEKEIAGHFDGRLTAAGERTACIIDLSPQSGSRGIEWGLTVLKELAEKLCGNSLPDDLYKLLKSDNFLFVLYTKHLLKEDHLKRVLLVDLSKMDYWQPSNRKEWANLDVPRQRKKPLLIYARQISDDEPLISKVAAWLKA